MSWILLSTKHQIILKVAALAAVLSCLCISAHASKSKIRLERVDSTQCAQNGTVTAYLSETAIDGTLVHRPPSEYRLATDEQLLPTRASHAESFFSIGRPITLALIIQSTEANADATDAIKRASSQLLRAMPKSSRFVVISYGSNARRLVANGTSAQAQQAIAGIGPPETTANPALQQALQLALTTLTAKDSSTRRMAVVVSDGIDRMADWDQFRNLGNRSRRLKIPIQPIAYSAIDERGPLLNLGEIAKRSLGTFRWAKTASEIPRCFDQLTQELNKQQILTFSLKRCPSAKRYYITAGALQSNVAIAVTKPRKAVQNDKKTATEITPITFIVIVLLIAIGLSGIAFWISRGFRDTKHSGKKKHKSADRNR